MLPDAQTDTDIMHEPITPIPGLKIINEKILMKAALKCFEVFHNHSVAPCIYILSHKQYLVPSRNEIECSLSSR